MDKLQELIDNSVAWVKDLYASSGDPEFEIMSTWIGVTEDRDVYFIATPYHGETPEEAELSKTKSIAMVKVVFAAKRVTHYVHVSEAWVASVDKDTSEEVKRLKPSERADRREVVVVIGADDEGNTAGTHLEIKRDGSHPTLTQSDVKPDGFGGRMTEMLNVPPMPDELREMINAQLEEMNIKPTTFH